MTLSLYVVGMAAYLGTSCALPVRSPRFTLRLNMAPDANEHAPVPVDVVFVWDKPVASQIAGLTAKDWFSKKSQFRQDDPDGKALTICEWEWVPGQQIPDINFVVPAAARSWVQGAFAFANYRQDGSYRYQLVPNATTVLDLLDTRIEYEPLRSPSTTRADYEVLSGITACSSRESSK